MIKFELDHFDVNTASDGTVYEYPVYNAIVISDDLIFGREVQ